MDDQKDSFDHAQAGKNVVDGAIADFESLEASASANDSPTVNTHSHTHSHAAQHNPSAPANVSRLDMTNVAAALPEYTYRQLPQSMYQQPYSHHIQQGSPMIYSYQSVPFPGAMQNNYSIPFPQQIHPQAFPPQRAYAHYPINSHLGPGQQLYQGQAIFSPHSPHSPNMHGAFHSIPQGQAYGPSQNTMYATRGTLPYYGAQVRVDGFGSPAGSGQSFTANEVQGIRRTSSANSLTVSAALRGPPRKPKQSGHALWVGNLPPGTNIIELKDHFSRDATDDIESVFLISKSNCAFVNYKSEESCSAAMGRFHDSRFNGVRLVCRLRRGSSPTSAATPVTSHAGSISDSRGDTMPNLTPSTTQEEDVEVDRVERDDSITKVKERYFIIKSLTVEDLERSVSSGIWATQSHNEEALNKAYQTAENVYLIFSANKSGEYFGYARMDTAIDGESASTIDVTSSESQTPQQPVDLNTSELPLTIPTPATSTAPKGYIIDDSARGTIFWEAEVNTPQAEAGGVGLSPANTESGNVSGEEITDVQPMSPSSTSFANTSTTFGKPFKITWMSTERLPFYRTRGLRNPWNTNREVKIARDGTELEPGVGRKLVGMFNASMIANRTQQPVYPLVMGSMPGQGPAYRPY